MSRVTLAIVALALLLPLPGHADTPAAPADTSGDAASKRGANVSFDQETAHADSLLKLRGGSHAENAQLFLAWHAPWGMPGATRVCMPACADSSGCDTLFLSFFPGRSCESFNGLLAELYFHATGQDTLGPWWHMESAGGENGGNMLVEWGPSRDMPGREPWTRFGYSSATIDRTPTTLRLRLIYAFALGQGSPLDSGSVYTVCRLLIRHHHSRGIAGCVQPVCVEWGKASLAFALKDEPEVRRGERLVSYGAPYAVCEPYRTPIQRGWKPRFPLK